VYFYFDVKMSNYSYQQEIYAHYLGQNLNIDDFVRNLNRETSDRQFQAWWGDMLPQELNVPILDLGCGWGGFLAFLQAKGYTNLTGVDNSPQQVEIAHRLGLKNVAVGDIFDSLNSHKDYYACITAFNVLEHLDKDQILPFLRAAKDALKPNGCLLLELPNANSLFGTRTRYWDFTHELSFTPTSLAQLFEVVSFERVQFRERAPVVHGVKSVIRSVLWQGIRQMLSLYLLIEQGSPGYKVFTQDMHAIAFKSK
jgi:2-polyprenyl-3-methyl-5-hydroxy-6-metoxy-1,4-benzoquinol methylase